ncbi:MAG: PA0069 family radical SAM protein [Yoonia sp.]|uniref:PA0069 family radical SAM protein n=1 Tax=Yoonia sp. TaxID=2212373 RepID=UPI003EF76FC3
MRNLPVQPLHRTPGRAAGSNPDVRFDRLHAETVDDGWARDDELPVLRTQVSDELARKVISRNTSPDLSFDRSINPYRGCEHGCIYCFARPSHAFLGLSPGLDFETKLIARPNAAAQLRKELSHPKYEPRILAIGTNTDPYQPIEKARGIMRDVVQVLAEFRHPLGIVTKGTLIERDIDILAPMARDGLLRVGISITTLDPKVSRVMEPRVPSPKARLRTIRALTEAGIPVRVMVSPVVPALTDHELEAILQAAADAGAVAASSIVLRLPLEVAPLFEEWVKTHFPDRAKRIMRRVRELHGGKTYDPDFGKRMVGQGPWAQMMQQRFKLAAARLALDRSLPALRSDLFERPAQSGDQLSLF